MRARHVIEEIGGEVLAEAFGADSNGRSAYMLGFTIGGEKCKIVWPVLPSKEGNLHAANSGDYVAVPRRQESLHDGVGAGRAVGVLQLPDAG